MRLFVWIFPIILLAVAFGIINVMWLETEEMLGPDKEE